MKAQSQPNSRLGRSVPEFKRALEDNLNFTRGQAVYTASHNDIYNTIAYTVRDHLMDRWRRTVRAYYEANPKFVYYFSAEYLMGRQLPQNLLYTDTEALTRDALAEYKLNLDRYLDEDAEPGLGNGGLGRLAACFLDSLATLGVPCVGYGLRYEFGIFEQTIRDGWQVERPDEWLKFGNPWEFAQPDEMVDVGFGGHTEWVNDENGKFHVHWRPAETVYGEPFHTMVPGYETQNVNVLRLWRARASEEFDFQLFDVGDYVRAVEEKIHSENISKVLYPNDNTPQGQELRLRQQYFFIACSLRDILRRYRVCNGDDLANLPDKAAIQLNDTHPVIAIPELMRLLMDRHGLEWDTAWDLCRRTFASTQHTLLPEALEEWPVGLVQRLLPRHMEIIREIDRRFADEVRARFPGDEDRVRRTAIITGGDDPRVRMAYLACVGSHSVNGVAELQSQLLVERVLPDLAEMWPDRFNNKTNGVSPRRFMRLANPALCQLIDKTVGPGWLNRLDDLTKLEKHADEPELQQRWRDVKRANKCALAKVIADRGGPDVDPDSIFDVMVKRLHEYKRQLLKVLHIITLYNRLKADPTLEIEPRTFIFGAKAAPGYDMAKLIIKLINSVGETLENDRQVADRLRVVFMENFNVSLGEAIYPAADISEQISLAGKEASGTGNMKFALNGALTTGTLDGANIEIREHVGDDNFFLFGLTTEEVYARKEAGYRPRDHYETDDELRQAIDSLTDGTFSGGDRELFQPLVDSLLNHDEYLLLADYRSYVDIQDQAAEAYRDRNRWTRMSILNTARCGFFSSDRSMRQYCSDIWEAHPVEVPEKDTP